MTLYNVREVCGWTAARAAAGQMKKREEAAARGERAVMCASLPQISVQRLRVDRTSMQVIGGRKFATASSPPTCVLLRPLAVSCDLRPVLYSWYCFLNRAVPIL